MNEEIMLVACRLISDAGDGASHFLKAIKEAENKCFEDASRLFKNGSDSLLQAHKQQTSLLHDEAQGKNSEISLLLIHAQDHLMNANLLKELTQNIINLNKRIALLEDGLYE